MLISLDKIKSRSGGNVYSTFGVYIIQLIALCESVIGSVIAEHLECYADKLLVLTNDELVMNLKNLLLNQIQC